MITNKYSNDSKTINNKSINNKNIHFGFSILKNFLAFNVIVSHCYNFNSTKNKIILFIVKKRKIHVPSFFIMSFYFNHNTLISLDTKKKKNRFYRLLIPYFGWPIIIFIFKDIYQIYKISNKLGLIKILIIQLITGQGTGLFHFWFLLDLIFITFIFHLIIFFFRNNYLFILNLLLLFSYIVQYSNLSRIIIYHTHKYHALSRVQEIFPFAVTGFTLSSLKIFKILDNYKMNTIIFCIIIFYIVRIYKIFANFFGVAYNGIKLNVASVCIIIIVSFFPMKNIKHKYLVVLLKYLTNYSAGIFYLHQVAQFYSSRFFDDIRKGNFIGIILIYFICYLISVSGASIFKNSMAKNLFA